MEDNNQWVLFLTIQIIILYFIGCIGEIFDKYCLRLWGLHSKLAPYPAHETTHSWYLPYCQCTETYSCVSSIQKIYYKGVNTENYELADFIRKGYWLPISTFFMFQFLSKWMMVNWFEQFYCQLANNLWQNIVNLRAILERTLGNPMALFDHTIGKGIFTKRITINWSEQFYCQQAINNNRAPWTHDQLSKQTFSVKTLWPDLCGIHNYK